MVHMIRLSGLKLSLKKAEEEKKALSELLCQTCKLDLTQIEHIKIIKKSLDARKKSEIHYAYTIDIVLTGKQAEKRLLERGKKYSPSLVREFHYEIKPTGTIPLHHRPVVVGSGPAGLFCALMLAQNGWQPLVLERGGKIEERKEIVEQFWKTNQLDSNTNVQFGEGGAGTFSDGKLNTMVKDPIGRNKKVLEMFAEFGAPAEILYSNKPHIGTDYLQHVVKAMRERIIELGGEVWFHSALTNIEWNTQVVQGEKIECVSQIVVNHTKVIPCEVVVLAIGHSARDTFQILHTKGLTMQAKPFAVGVRVEHSQEWLNRSQYGNDTYKTYANYLPSADYKLTYQASNQRSIYSFCMCPGGFVVNASSEQGKLVVNGMSNYKRDERNANSALIVNVTPDDFEGTSPLRGMYFQQYWEAKAYEMGHGNIPIQLYGDFKRNQISSQLGTILPNTKGKYQMTNVRECIPNFVTEALLEGMEAFNQKIPGYATEDAILLGVETRTSSPIKILRDEWLQSNKRGIYPCGEGAGYAGGITSAAIDGLKVSEAIMKQYYKK